jgi:hypothetical protein
VKRGETKFKAGGRGSWEGEAPAEPVSSEELGAKMAVRVQTATIYYISLTLSSPEKPQNIVVTRTNDHKM